MSLLRDPKVVGERAERRPGGASLKAKRGERINRNERRARSKREQRRLSERYRIPSANFIVATLHRRDCSLKFDLSSDETSATGSHQSFAHFDSRKR